MTPSDVLKHIDLHTGHRAEALLSRAVARCTDQRAIAVFDLDSTLLNNHPRQIRIMREFARDRGIDQLEHIDAHHLAGWDAVAAMTNAGLPRERAEELEPDYKDFWRERFFTSHYCSVDTPTAGATGYVRRILDAGGRLYYVTGRHEPMRSGTVESFERGGFPLPDGERVQLHMKPTLEEDDDDYKARTHRELERAGRVVAAFDNEPVHINDYQRSFSDAVVVHLATDHSLRPVRVADGIPSIRDFTGQ